MCEIGNAAWRRRRGAAIRGAGDAGEQGFEVAPRSLFRSTLPRCSRRQLGDASGERGEGDLVRVGGRQGDLDAGDYLGDATGRLDQEEADRIELGVAPERCPGASPRRLNINQ